MINVTTNRVTGAYEASAMVTDIMTRQSFLERKTYYGYDSKTQVRRDFLMHLINNHLIEMLDY